MTSKVKLMAQIRRRLGNKGDYQELMVALNQAYAVAVKNSWFQGKNEGISEIGGAFIYPFKNVDVVLDEDVNMYYATLPATYVDIPHEMGIVSVSLMKSQDDPFIRLSPGHIGMIKGLDVEGLEGNHSYFVENNRIYLPTIKASDSVSELFIKLSVALDGVEDDDEISIPPDVQKIIIDMVVQQYAPAESIKEEESLN